MKMIQVVILLLFSIQGFAVNKSSSTNLKDWSLTGKFDSGYSSGCQMACASKGNFSKTQINEQPNVKVGDLTRCPVSGVVFKVKPNSAQTKFLGESLYFCCDSCKQRFFKESKRFVSIQKKK